MSTVPKITHEEWLAAVSALPANHDYRPSDIANKALATKYSLAEQQEITEFAKKRSGMEFDEWQGKPPQQESEYITATQARELGAGNAEIEIVPGGWIVCGAACGYIDKYLGIDIRYRAIKQAQPVSWDTKYIDSTPKLSVGNSAFEDWFQAQEFATLAGVKQMCRDSYAAGMGDPLVTYATTQAQPEPVEQWQENDNSRGFDKLAEKQSPELLIPVDPHAALRAEYAKQVAEGTTGFYLWEFIGGGVFVECTDSPKFANGFKYRYTDISCYVSKDGEPAIRMLIEDAEQLRCNLGNSVDWFITVGSTLNLDIITNHQYELEAGKTYTYRTKATIKLNGNMMLRDAAWRLISLSDKDLYTRWRGGEWRISEAKNCGELNDINWKNAEYELRPKQPTWTGSRADVLALLKEKELL